MTRISAIVITQDEERNMARCLASLQGVADEVIVVDSGSTDATESICRQYGARFEHHDWAGYSGQKNYANSLASHPWTLSIDADEALSPALRATLLQLKEHSLRNDSVYQCHRLSNFCGSWIHHCGWYPDTKIRLWPTGHAQWHGTIHEELIHDQCPNTVTLKGDLLHYTFYTLDEMTQRHRRYYLLAAQSAYQAGRRASMAAVVLKPLWSFLRGYVLLGGFLDGYAGYLVCRMNAHYTFMKYATLRELAKTKTEHQK